MEEEIQSMSVGHSFKGGKIRILSVEKEIQWMRIFDQG